MMEAFRCLSPLNAMSHRSGVGDTRYKSHLEVPSCGDKQPELHHAGRRDRLVVQQITGEAIFGASKGQRLKPVPHDELSFSFERGTSQRKSIATRRHQTVEAVLGRLGGAHRETSSSSALNPDTSLSLELKSSDQDRCCPKAYPLSTIQEQNPILDFIADTPVIIVVAEDNKSVRAFERRIDGRELEFFAKPDSQALRLWMRKRAAIGIHR